MDFFSLFAKTNKFKRVFLIVLDSVGIGETLDAVDYNDEGANTLQHVFDNTPHEYKNFAKLGLFNLLKDKEVDNAIAYHMKAIPKSIGKDSLSGHLELMGVVNDKPYKNYCAEGFPKQLIKEIEKMTGRKVICNTAENENFIIKNYAYEHMKTGALIIYTTPNSELIVAAHEGIIPINELYKICNAIRQITSTDEYNIARVVARPFIGNNGNFIKTTNRRDFVIPTKEKTVLDRMTEKGFTVLGIGKINEMYGGRGITEYVRTIDNTDGIRRTIELIGKPFNGLCFTNLNDFDAKYGHNRDVVGYANALREFDEAIPHMISHLTSSDLLIITADHGNDPTFKGNDHTRENVPVYVYSPLLKNPERLDNCKTLADIAATISENFGLEMPQHGKSFLSKLK